MMNADSAVRPPTATRGSKRAFLETVLNPTMEAPSIADWSLPQTSVRESAPGYYPLRLLVRSQVRPYPPTIDRYNFLPGTAIRRGDVKYHQGFQFWYRCDKKGMKVGSGRLPKYIVDEHTNPQVRPPKPSVSAVSAPNRHGALAESCTDVAAQAEQVAPSVSAEGASAHADEVGTVVGPVHSDGTNEHMDPQRGDPLLDSLLLPAPDITPLSSRLPASGQGAASVAECVPSSVAMPSAPVTAAPGIALQESSAWQFIEPNQVTKYGSRRSRPYPPPSMLHRWVLPS